MRLPDQWRGQGSEVTLRRLKFVFNKTRAKQRRMSASAKQMREQGSGEPRVLPSSLIVTGVLESFPAELASNAYRVCMAVNARVYVIRYRVS